MEAATFASTANRNWQYGFKGKVIISMNWDAQIDENSNVVRLRTLGARGAIYTEDNLLNSATGLFCIVWTVTTMMRDMSAAAISGEDTTEFMKTFYFLSPIEKERYEMNIARIMQEKIWDSLNQIMELPNASMDALVTTNASRFRSSDI